MSPLKQAKKELAELRAAKKRAVDKMFDRIFDSIFVDPLMIQYEYTDADKEAYRVALTQFKKEMSSTESLRKHNERLEYLLLDPADNPTYVVDAIRSKLIGGDIEGVINGEYWNEYNQDDPMEMHPKCVGDISGIKGFNDTEEGKMYAREEQLILKKIELLSACN